MCIIDFIKRQLIANFLNSRLAIGNHKIFVVYIFTGAWQPSINESFGIAGRVFTKQIMYVQLSFENCVYVCDSKYFLPLICMVN